MNTELNAPKLIETLGQRHLEHPRGEGTDINVDLFKQPIKNHPERRLVLAYVTVILTIAPLGGDVDSFWVYFKDINKEEYQRVAAELGTEEVLKEAVHSAYVDMVQHRHPDGIIVTPEKLLNSLWANLFVAVNYDHSERKHLGGNVVVKLA